VAHGSPEVRFEEIALSPPSPFRANFLFADKPGTGRVGKHLGVYRDQFEKWMDGLMEWKATEKQRLAYILRTAC
jgi:hypothetical protein